MRLLPIGLLSLALGGAGGVALPFVPRSAPPDEAHLCVGEENPLAVELEPLAVRQVDGKEVLDLELAVSHRRGEALSLAYAVEVVDDGGNPVSPVQRSPRVDLKGAGAQHVLRAATPAGLRDGFYLVRASVGALSGDQELSDYRHLYFEVRSGKTTPIDHDRWMTHSNAGQMRSAR